MELGVVQLVLRTYRVRRAPFHRCPTEADAISLAGLTDDRFCKFEPARRVRDRRGRFAEDGATVYRCRLLGRDRKGGWTSRCGLVRLCAEHWMRAFALHDVNQLCLDKRRSLSGKPRLLDLPSS